jgi:DNA polymerase III delta prime subunit
MDYYATSFDHILAELERIDLLIQHRVWQLRQIQTIDEQFQGLYISEQQIEDLLSQPIGQPHWAAAPDFPASTEIKTALTKLATLIEKRKTKSLKLGICLRLEQLTKLFNLKAIEINILLICLAIELDLRYEKFYAYLQDDVNKKRPSVELVLNLLSSSIEEKISLRQQFTSNLPLVKHRLLNVLIDPSLLHQPLLSQFLQVDRRIVNYLLDSDDLDPKLIPYTELCIPQSTWSDLIIADEMKDRLCQLSQLPTLKQTGFILYFQGNSGIGKRKTAEAICQQLKLRLLVVEGKLLSYRENIETIVHLLCREALLQNAALYWNNFDISIAEIKHLFPDTLLKYFLLYPLPIFLAGAQDFKLTVREKPCLSIRFTNPSAVERLQLWQKFRSDRFVQISDLELGELVSKFRLSGEQIQTAISTAHNLALWRNPDNPQVTLADCYTACRMQSNQQLTSLARKITPHYQWDDLVLAPEPLQQLRETCGYVKHRTLIYDRWGFDRKLALGKGLSILFSGASGTGKTMAADIMAGELGLELYKIDLSGVVSKYIGETEKNLAQIFIEAETSNAILFFDEADALFGKRSDVKDARDRYANIETSYLLQRMEEYKGIVILATNFRKNMDDAFVRRLHFIIDFPFPTERHRRQIWGKIFPTDTPLNTNLNLDVLANRFELSGGNIRNIALAAAFLAAEDEEIVEKIHLIRAIKRECQKMGRLMTDKDFEGYL